MEVVAAIVGAVVGVIAGFGLSELKNWLTRSRKLKSHWATLRSDIEVCRQKGQMYIEDNVMAPLYRLPTLAYDHCLPELIVEGEVSEDELAKLTQFFRQASDVNRGLDLASSLLGTTADQSNATLQSIANRNRMYARKLIPGEQDELYSGASAVINAHV